MTTNAGSESESHSRSGSSPSCLGGFGPGRILVLLAFLLMCAVTYTHLDRDTVTRLLVMIRGDPWGTAHIFIVMYAVSVILLFPCM